jgi:hypothetical protein
VITPYAQFSFNYVGEDERSSLRLVFRRRTDVMPPAPQVGERWREAAVWGELLGRGCARAQPQPH